MVPDSTHVREVSRTEHPSPWRADGHNQWVDELAADIEFEPLREFILRLKEPPEPATQARAAVIHAEANASKCGRPE